MRNPRVVRDALIRQRWALHQAIAENDAAIVAWDAIDDQHIADAQVGLADCRKALGDDNPQLQTTDDVWRATIG